ncbi:MAG: sulfur oxidation c-type cytochrome SoxX [Gammaproteobacteria bacterium]|nr:MAG: sulfur oxidation c-type cytochrome SoxX [Gammaproteobacteria bacterium]
MRHTAKLIIGVCTLVISMAGLVYSPGAFAAGKAPDKKTCKAKPTDVVTQGGCIVINRKKGNCMACHQIAGTSANGNVATRLNYMRQKYGKNKKRLYDQVYDATKFNKNTSMPPFGRHAILSKKEIEKVVEFLLTL